MRTVTRAEERGKTQAAGRDRARVPGEPAASSSALMSRPGPEVPQPLVPSPPFQQLLCLLSLSGCVSQVWSAAPGAPCVLHWVVLTGSQCSGVRRVLSEPAVCHPLGQRAATYLHSSS